MNPKKLQTISYKAKPDGDLISYQITFDPIYSSIEKKLSPLEMKQYLLLLESAQTTKEHFAEVEKLHEKHSDIPEISNLLTFILIQKKEIQKAEKLIEETYKKNPDYLFAKINYADQCLRKKKVKTILEIFPSFSLFELYPSREFFHFTEFRGFMVVMAYYHLAIKEKAQALQFYEAAMQADPAHLSVIALEKRVLKTSFLQAMKEGAKTGFLSLLLQRRSS